MICYIAEISKLDFIKPRCNGGRPSTFAGNSDVIGFGNVARSEIVTGNSFIVRRHVTSK